MDKNLARLGKSKRYVAERGDRQIKNAFENKHEASNVKEPRADWIRGAQCRVQGQGWGRDWVKVVKGLSYHANELLFYPEDHGRLAKGIDENK